MPRIHGRVAYIAKQQSAEAGARHAQTGLSEAEGTLPQEVRV
jgi:hypothetical protein